MAKSSRLFCKICNKGLRHLSSTGKLYSYCSKCGVNKTNYYRSLKPDCRKLEYKRKLIKHGHIKAQGKDIRYGITEDDYDKLLKEQNGTCAICGVSPKRRRLDIDHDHKTKKVRGLLCHMCNRGLGFFRDRPERFIRAANYLQRGH